ncbi:MAG: methylmalonyl-CoA mutase [Prosthecobacter sp.]
MSLNDWLAASGVSQSALGTAENMPPPLPVRKTAVAWKLAGEEGTGPACGPPVTFAATPEEELSLLLANAGGSTAELTVSAGMRFVDTLAKLRALRLLAAALGNPQAKIRAIAVAEGEPALALVRVTVRTLFAVLGTADVVEIHTPGFPEAGEDDSHPLSPAGLARAVAAILREEAGLAAAADPAAGSFLVERRTRELCTAVWSSLHPGGAFVFPESQTPHAEPVGMPGFPPFVRGPHASMYLRSPWTIRQYGGFSTADDTNAFYRNALAEGQHGLSVAFDLPTHRGYDSDHPRVSGDVGKAGVAIDSVEDMKRLFADIPLDKMSVSMTMSGAVLPVMAFFVAAAQEMGVPPAALSGTIQNDILKEYMVRNTYIYPPAASMRITGEIMGWLQAHSPRFNSVSISGYHMHEAGATAVQELAYTLGNGLEYLKAGCAMDGHVDAIAARLSFFWAQGMSHLTETAKLRAARGLWARLMREAGVTKERGMTLRCHCQTSGWSLARQLAPYNIVRTTVEALSAVLGHTQSLHTNSLDEAIALPSDAAARIALQTQLILQQETDLCAIIDPWGGSLEVERLTRRLAEEAWQEIEDIMAVGGMAVAVAKGLPQRRIERVSAERQARIDSGTEKTVGVNFMQHSGEDRLEVREIDNHEVRDAQVARLEAVKATRDAAATQAALDELERVAREGGSNLLEAAIQAARSRASLGEISSALERVFGRHSAMALPAAGVYGGAMSVEADLLRLRERTAEFAQRHGRRPRMLVAKLGQDGHDRGAKVVACAFADFGFDVDLAPLFGTPEEVCRQALDNDVHLVGVSTLAGGHKTLVPELVRHLREADATHVKVSVGGIIPDGDHAFLHEAGVAAIFGPGSRLPDCAHQLLDCLNASQS